MFLPFAHELSNPRTHFFRINLACCIVWLGQVPVEVEKIVYVDKPIEIERIVYVDKLVEIERIVEVDRPVVQVIVRIVTYSCLNH